MYQHHVTKYQQLSKIVYSPKLKLNIVPNVRNNYKERELTSGVKWHPPEILGDSLSSLGSGGGNDGW